MRQDGLLCNCLVSSNGVRGVHEFIDSISLQSNLQTERSHFTLLPQTIFSVQIKSQPAHTGSRNHTIKKVRPWQTPSLRQHIHKGGTVVFWEKPQNTPQAVQETEGKDMRERGVVDAPHHLPYHNNMGLFVQVRVCLFVCVCVCLFLCLGVWVSVR